MTASSSPRLLVFPGLGADSRMYLALRRSMPEAETPDWTPQRKGESLREYSARWGEALQLRERPAVLAGLSMGGMVALEMARAHGARAVVLMASCRGPQEISPIMKVCEGASRCVPRFVLDKGRSLAGVFVGRGKMPAESKAALVQMVREADVDFIRWAARAIMTWEGCPDPGVPVHHIHGDRDWVIPRSRVSALETIGRGAHVLNMSHPAEIEAYLRRVVQSLPTAPTSAT